MINFLSKLPWLLRISLISIGFFLGAILIFAGHLLIEGRSEAFLILSVQKVKNVNSLDKQTTKRYLCSGELIKALPMKHLAM